jgi:hypothetical protein
MSLWAISGAPLLVGADLTTLNDASLATLTNRDVLAVDQDSLGLQAVKVASYGDGLEVWSKALSTPGARAVLLLNRTGDAASITVHWSDLGLEASSPATLKDVWARKDLGTFTTSYSATVPPVDAAMVVVHGSEDKLTTHTAPGAEDSGEGHEVIFTHIASRVPMARIRIDYINPDKTPRYSELRVNGKIATRVAFPPTGGGNVMGEVWVEESLDRTHSDNVLNFSAVSGPGPEIESISLE